MELLLKGFFLHWWEILGRISSKPDVGLEVFKTPSYMCTDMYLVYLQPVITHLNVEYVSLSGFLLFGQV